MVRNNGRVCVLLMCGVVGALAFRAPSLHCSSAMSALVRQNHHRVVSLPSVHVHHHAEMSLFAQEDNTSEGGGVESKYLVALGVFILAALYDYFVTHNGMKDGWVI